ncbi:type 1 glutamine amidotransferase [Actinomyces slackii]|uniref:Glutamine amidotransferase n=1 Tax=Actinomyces slackii TaxID=52774 RepID=A0A448KBB9_9ACTO|nr:type 1 glutamine amidotransferase [Actinomyces slackii]VEG74238.1 glutamine amidotransferase [Actinomyces slackii]
MTETPRNDRSVSAEALAITVIEPERGAPLGRLGEWLFAEGASLTMVRLWQGEPVPALAELGDGLVVLGGAMNAHDDETHPWLEDLRALLREVVAARMPAITICLGAQVAAEALGGQTAVPSPHGREGGIVELELTQAAEADPLFAETVAEAVRAAVRAGIPTQDGTRLPVIVSHDDVVVALPQDAVLLASSQAAPVQAWRAGKLLALQHHPESSPERIGYWQARSFLRHQGVSGADSLPEEDMPAEAIEVGKAATQAAREVDPVIQAFGRALARGFARESRAYAARRTTA